MKIKFKDIFIPTISLLLICLIVAVALSLTNSITKTQIEKNEAESKKISMQSVCPDAKSFDEIEEDVLYAGKDDKGNTICHAVSTSANGYGGQVKVMTGIDSKGNIIKIDVFYNDDETPGLGKNTSNESFTKNFSGKKADGTLIVSKDYEGEGQQIDAVTSATISSRAVVAAVNEACTIYTQYVNGGEL